MVAAPAQVTSLADPAPLVSPVPVIPDAVQRLLALEAPAPDDRAARRLVLASPAVPAVGWMSARGLFARLVSAWADRWLSGIARVEEPRDGQLGGGDVLDRQADGLEHGDRAGRTGVDPVPFDGSDLHEVGFRD